VSSETGAIILRIEHFTMTFKVDWNTRYPIKEDIGDGLVKSQFRSVGNYIFNWAAKRGCRIIMANISRVQQRKPGETSERFDEFHLHIVGAGGGMAVSEKAIIWIG
jgi:hypothetical protein